MSEQLIFVSCGQSSPEEKQLGSLVKSVIDAIPAFRAYFAETANDLEALSVHVFDAIRKCAGAVVLFHERGTVTGSKGEDLGHRSSVWVNQELATLAYRQFFEERRIPILAFADPRVRLEGAMTSLIVHPRPLGEPTGVAQAVQRWLLEEEEFTATPDEVFLAKWNELPENVRMVVSVLIDQGGSRVKQDVARRGVVESFGITKEDASKATRDAQLWFIHTDLVKLDRNVHESPRVLRRLR